MYVSSSDNSAVHYVLRIMWMTLMGPMGQIKHDVSSSSPGGGTGGEL